MARLHSRRRSPFLSFPPPCVRWFTFSSSSSLQKIANWLESYADSLDLNVWTSAKVTAATFDAAAQRWSVSVQRGEHTRQLSASHFVSFLDISLLCSII